MDTVTEDQVAVSVFANATADIYTVSTRQSVIVPFYITVPSESTIKMEASLLLPSNGGKALFHAKDAKFGDVEGNTTRNVLCVNPSVDLVKTYETSFAQTANVTTYAQVPCHRHPS